MIFTLLAGLALAQDDCDDPEGRVRATERDIVSFYLSDASVSAKEAVDAMGCSGKAHPETVARLFLADGMIKFLGEDEAGAQLAFGSAKRIASDQWNVDYGEKAKALFDGALTDEVEPVEVALKGYNAQTDWAAVDGREETVPMMLQPGLHVLQVGHSDVARVARVIEIEAGTPLTISVPGGPVVSLTDDTGVEKGIVSGDSRQTVDAGPPTRKRKRRVMAAVGMGVVSAALYGGAVGARIGYDADGTDNSMLLWTTNGLYMASVAGGVTSGGLMIGALATPPL